MEGIYQFEMGLFHNKDFVYLYRPLFFVMALNCRRWTVYVNPIGKINSYIISSVNIY